MTRDDLKTITAAFLQAFNDNDLDAMMSYFAEDGVYEEFNGTRSQGLDAVRAAFKPQFSGGFGEMKFVDEDLMVDAETNKVMASWRCELEVNGKPTHWRGLDLLTFNDDGKVALKLTYAKAKVPLFQ